MRPSLFIETPLADSLTFVFAVQAAYDACDSSLGEVRTWQTSSATGDVNVTGLDIGSNYFLSYMTAHCGAGHMKCGGV